MKIKKRGSKLNKKARPRFCKSYASMSKLMLIGIGIIALIGLIVIASALTSDDKTALQAELDNLTTSVNDGGYSWLVDYNLSYPHVQVFRENSNELLAQFTSISSGENEIISRDALQMKMRIDETRGELNNYGVKNG